MGAFSQTRTCVSANFPYLCSRKLNDYGQQFRYTTFEDRQVRIVWDADAEEYYLSIVDVVQVLTDSVDATAYWRKLKQRLKAEGNEIVIVTD